MGQDRMLRDRLAVERRAQIDVVELANDMRGTNKVANGYRCEISSWPGKVITVARGNGDAMAVGWDHQHVALYTRLC